MRVKEPKFVYLGGVPVWRCYRELCGSYAQVKGGYCPGCFKRMTDEPFPRPEIVVLCGSNKFIDLFRAKNLEFTLAGKIVLSISCDMKSDTDLLADEKLTPKINKKLDDLHKRKIDIADLVYVINKNKYVGSSTNGQIEYAEWYEKTIEYMEPIDEM